MPVLGLIFLRYAYSRFKLVEQEILKDRPVRGGRVLPVEQSDFAEKSALFLPKEAQYNYLVNLPANIPEQGLTGIEGNPLNRLGEVVTTPWNWWSSRASSCRAFCRRTTPSSRMNCWGTAAHLQQ